MSRQVMAGASRRTFIPVLLACLVSFASAHEAKTDRFTVGAGTTVTIANDYGAITVNSGAGNQMVVTVGSHSADVQVLEDHSTPGRVELRTHQLRPGGSAPVDLNIQVPLDTPQIVIRTASGTVRVANVTASMSIDSDSGSVTVERSASSAAAGASNATVRVRTIDGSVTLAGLSQGKIDVATVSGAVTLSNNSAAAITVDTNSAPIHFSGNPPSGTCSLSAHAGDLDVALPASASVDITASSVNGTVQDGFQLQPDSHPAIPLVASKSFAGHANSGAAKMTLRTFSGKITVHKQ